MSRPPAEVARACVERTCAAHGVPVKVTDPASDRGAVVALVARPANPARCGRGRRSCGGVAQGPTIAQSTRTAMIALYVLRPTVSWRVPEVERRHSVRKTMT